MEIETLKSFAVRLLPDLVIATAAAGVFLLLGAVVLISILFENWLEVKKHRQQLDARESPPMVPVSRKSKRDHRPQVEFPLPDARLPYPSAQQV